MATLAIRGHKTRGKKVIEILEMLGGKNTHHQLGNEDKLCYFIEFGTNIIVPHYWDMCKNKSDFYILSLEDFLNKYPYKIGDEVIVVNERLTANGFIKSLYWYPRENIIRYEVDLSIYTQFCEVKELKPYKETMKEKLEQIKLTIPNGYEFFKVDDDNKVVLTKKQIQYPKNYKECCKVMGYCYNPVANKVMHKEKLIEAFQYLFFYRDAYWKIAGEQLGLSKPWEPDWENERYSIYRYKNNEIIKGLDVAKCIDRHILEFPTEEMRDAFYENFEDLIEQCKELL